MKEIIDIPEYVIDDMKECGFIPEEDNEELCKAIDNGTPIPDNATNTVDVLDKIRAEIDRLHYHPKLDFIKNDEVVDMALDIIDKQMK